MTIPEEQSKHYQIVAKAIEYLSSNTQNQPSLKEVASAVHMSEFHLQRIFSAWAGVTPKRFLQFLTKERAKHALRQSSSVLSTSMDIGLSSTSRLHDLMISCEAMTPGDIKNLGSRLTINYGMTPTCFGMTLIAWTDRGICHLAFCDDDETSSRTELFQLWPKATFKENPIEAAKWGKLIFSERPTRGKLHLILKGTNFQIKVWEALIRTQPSQLVSYQQVAKLVGSPNAQRAVGSAVAQNKIGYLIPCHRVIRDSGEIGNYRWGASRKQAAQLWESQMTETY